MAVLTAEDVLNKAFSKTKYREGFDQDEVDDFLDEVATAIATLTHERDALAAQLREAQTAAPRAAAPIAPSYGTPEPALAAPSLLGAATDPMNKQTPQEMIGIAQKLHDEQVAAGEEKKMKLIAEGEEQAAAILKRAEQAASDKELAAAGERAEIERKIDDLRRFERDYRARMKTYLENLLGDLDHGSGADRTPHTPPPL